LTDKDPDVRLAWASRHDYVASMEQIQRGLKERVDYVKEAWILRKEFHPTPGQCKRGLKSKNKVIRSAWEQKVCSMHEEKWNESEDECDSMDMFI